MFSAHFPPAVGLEPDGVTAFTTDLTSARITWNTPSPPDDTIGYEVYYTGPTNGSVTVDEFGGETDNVMLTGLVNGEAYYFFVAGKLAHFESERVAVKYGPLYLCKHFMRNTIEMIVELFKWPVYMSTLAPGAPALALVSTTVDSVTVSWSVPTGTVVDNFDLQWNVEREQQPETTFTEMVGGSIHRYTISGLSGLQNATVKIIVTAINGAGTNTSTPLTLHSDILRNMDSEGGDTDGADTSISFGALIGGAVGIFLVSIAAGILIAFVAHKCRENMKKK